MTKSIKFYWFLALALLVLSPFFFIKAHAADLRYPPQNTHSKQLVVVGSNENVRNLYAVGNGVVVDANSTKDTVVAGANISVNGNTADDLFAVGANVFVNGNVGGSLRVAGGTVTINGAVKEDLVVAGGNVLLSPHASIGGDILFFGGTLTLDGPVDGNVLVKAGSLGINSSIKGNVRFSGKQLDLGSSANILGTVDYTSALVYSRDPQAQVLGGVTFHESQTKNPFDFAGSFTALAIILAVLKFIAVLLFAFLLLWLLREKFQQAVQDSRKNFWKNTLYGLIFLVAVPILALVLLFTIVGFYISFALLAFYFLLLFVAWVIGAGTFGFWFMAFVARKELPFGFWTVLVALLVTFALEFVPVLGMIFALILLLSGIGALLKIIRNK